jgi:hypothetical protein
MKRRTIEIKNIRTSLIVVLVSVLMFISCSKTKGSGGIDDDDHHVDENDTTFPVIRIDSPLPNQVFVSGDTIKVEGLITDNGLYRGKIKITNDLSGLVVNEQLYETHFYTSFNFSFKHKTSVTVPTDYTITVEYEDHGLNVSTQTRKVKVNP